MSDRRRAEALRCLRLNEDASLLDLERAYRALRETYAEGSLATYALLDSQQRKEKLQELEAAYQLLHNDLSVSPREGEEQADIQPAMDNSPLPEGLTPGEELECWRERRGLTIHEVGVRTKISPMTLSNIEKQLFERLPAPVYLRGFLVQYLSLLEVPGSDALVERYLGGYAENQD